MRIAIAQTKSLKGAIAANLSKHLRFVQRAIKENADLVVFPELSLSNYEPILAKKLACDPLNPLFNSLQKLADQSGINIGAGMPIKRAEGTVIAMLLFQANAARHVHEKQILHADELPYFCPGKSPTYLQIKGYKVAFGICFEAVQEEHFLNALHNGAQVYVASVAKEKTGMVQAAQYFQKTAKKHATPILVSNGIGKCHQFTSSGSSAVWDEKGNQLNMLSDEQEGLLTYDLKTGEINSKNWKISTGETTHLQQILSLYQSARAALEKMGIYQWTDRYPTPELIERDLKSGQLYLLHENDLVLGAIHLSSDQEEEYKSVNWNCSGSEALVVHRLVVAPDQQRKGFASDLMDFAETFAHQHKQTSIRLDAYSQNKGVLELYQKRGYHKRGEIRFPEREHAFHCLEKNLKP